MREANGEERIRIRMHTCLMHDAGAGPLTEMRHHLVPDALLIRSSSLDSDATSEDKTPNETTAI